MTWRTIPFETFITLQRGFDLPQSNMLEGDVPVLGSNCVIGHHNEAKVNPPGVVTGRSGTLGLVQYTDEPFWPHNTALWVKDFKGNSPKFVYYKLKTLRLDTFNGGASVPTLNRNVLDTLPVKLPGYDIQCRIANILSAYDDLIENNRRRIKLLEEAARLIYREWFVHFRFPGHERVKITNGIPVGWLKSAIAGVCNSFKDGDWIESKDQGGNDFRLLQISNIGENEFIETENYRHITADTFRNLRCTEVVPGDILISRMPTPIGRAWHVTKMPWRMITAVDVTIARPNTTVVNEYYYLYHLNSRNHLALCSAHATGTTRPRISRKTMGDLPILLPPKPLQEMFGKFAEHSNTLRTNLIRQNCKLSQARDILLPRLMNGEIKV